MLLELDFHFILLTLSFKVLLKAMNLAPINVYRILMYSYSKYQYL